MTQHATDGMLWIKWGLEWNVKGASHHLKWLKDNPDAGDVNLQLRSSRHLLKMV